VHNSLSLQNRLAILHNVFPLDNPQDYNNKGNDKQGVNDATGMKYEEPEQPANDQDDCNDRK